MLATPRRLLLALVALAACTPDLIAGVICTPNGNGSWTCSGDGSGYNPDYPYQPGEVVTNTVYVPTVQTNVLGVCTNCVAMTPETCESLKTQLMTGLQQINDKCDSFNETIDESIEHGLNETQLFIQGVSDLMVDGLADYLVDDIQSYIDNFIPRFRDDINFIQSQSRSLHGIADDIKCSTCTASFGGDTPSGGGGGGGGGGSGSGSSSCPDCPCKEQMEALRDLLKDDFLPRIKKIDNNVAQLTNLLYYAKQQLEVTRRGFNDVTNLFNRLDDYVLDDFSNRVYQIRMDVNFIASNLVDKVSSLFINNNYSNAVFYADNDGNDVVMSELKDKLVDEKNTEGKRFDFGEFGKLPWFTRIEFLLTDIAGYYDKTNSPVSEIEKLKKKVSDFEASSKSDNQSMSNKVEAIASDQMSSVNTALSRLWGYFSFFGSGGNSSIEGVEIMGGDLSDYFGEDAQSLHIYAFDDNDESIEKFDSFLEIVRYCFQALYLAGFSFVLFKLLLFLYAKIGLVINYLLKFYAAIFGSS